MWLEKSFIEHQDMSVPAPPPRSIREHTGNYRQTLLHHRICYRWFKGRVRYSIQDFGIGTFFSFLFTRTRSRYIPGGRGMFRAFIMKLSIRSACFLLHSLFGVFLTHAAYLRTKARRSSRWHTMWSHWGYEQSQGQTGRGESYIYLLLLSACPNIWFPCTHDPCDAQPQVSIV